MTGAPLPDTVDLAIVGGGLVGASLALALKDTPLSVALIEQSPVHTEAHPSFDAKVLALSNATRRVFETIGLWPHCQSQLSVVKKIHVSEQGSFGSVQIDAQEMGIDQLGFVLPARALGAQLIKALESTAVHVSNGTTVRALHTASDAACLSLQTPQGTRPLNARLVVAADGADSSLRQMASIATRSQDYHQRALISAVEVSHPVPEVAFERFTADGLLAVLPRADHVIVIWAVDRRRADELCALSDAATLKQLQNALGWRLGQLKTIGPRQSYDLRLTVAQRLWSERVVLMGNAAQSVHPIAGQGFNLGLRDAMALAERVVATHDAGGDVGSADGLARYAASRAADRARVIQFTDGLVKGFGLRAPVIKSMRSLLLQGFDALLPLQRHLAAIGSGGQNAPRLSRGLGLRPGAFS